MQTSETNDSVSSNERLLNLVQEAKNELLKIQPEIDYLEQCQQKLIKLKEQQFRLNSLIASLNGLINTTDVNIEDRNFRNVTYETQNNNQKVINVTKQINNEQKRREIFLPDQAINQVKSFLRTKNNLNYEIFKAVVFNSGTATTEDIKKYLVDNNIKQPKTGKSFDTVELKEISSRANYLVRKNILVSTQSGTFRSIYGWQTII